MSKLGNNYTTTEQSKQLLELGLPVNSADCYTWDSLIFIRNNRMKNKEFFERLKKEISPCWSAGRLIEILEIIFGTPWSDHEELGKSTLIERVFRDFKDVVKYKEKFKDSRIDFSKLNDYEI